MTTKRKPKGRLPNAKPFMLKAFTMGGTMHMTRNTPREVHKLLLNDETSPLVRVNDTELLWKSVSGTVLDFVGYDSKTCEFFGCQSTNASVVDVFNYLRSTGCKAQWMIDIEVGLYPRDANIDENTELLHIADMTHEELDTYLSLSSGGKRSAIKLNLEAEDPVTCVAWVNEIQGDTTHMILTHTNEDGYLNTTESSRNPRSIIEYGLNHVNYILELDGYENYNISSLKVNAKIVGVA